MINGLTLEQIDEYEVAISLAMNAAVAAVCVAEIGKNAFTNIQYRPRMVDAYDKMRHDYEQTASCFMQYANESGLGVNFPDEIISQLRMRATGSISLAELEDCWYEFIAPGLNTMADLLNTSLRQADTVFQRAICVASTALRIGDSDISNLLFSRSGVLRRAAHNMILIQVRAMPLQYPNGLVLKRDKTDSELRSMPLADYDFSSPMMKYMPPDFMLINIPNEDGSLVAGTKATVASIEGEFIRPDSAESDRMIEELVESWLDSLIRDNEIVL